MNHQRNSPLRKSDGFPRGINLRETWLHRCISQRNFLINFIQVSDLHLHFLQPLCVILKPFDHRLNLFSLNSLQFLSHLVEPHHKLICLLLGFAYPFILSSDLNANVVPCGHYHLLAMRVHVGQSHFIVLLLLLHLVNHFYLLFPFKIDIGELLLDFLEGEFILLLVNLLLLVAALDLGLKVAHFLVVLGDLLCQL